LVFLVNLGRCGIKKFMGIAEKFWARVSPLLDHGAIARFAPTDAERRRFERLRKQKGAPDIDLVAAIATALGVAPHWLAFGNQYEESIYEISDSVATSPPAHRPQSPESPTESLEASLVSGAIVEPEEMAVVNELKATGKASDARALRGLTGLPKLPNPSASAKKTSSGRQNAHSQSGEPNVR
jgi:hypothetical protein